MAHDPNKIEDHKVSPERGGGRTPDPPDPKDVPQGTKNPDVKDKADRTEHPTPHRK